MFKVRKNSLFENNKINYINEYDVKCMVKLEMLNNKILFAFKIKDYPMFRYEFTPNILYISNDFMDKYCGYIENINEYMPSEDIISDMISLVYRWNMIYSMLNILENIHNEYIFNQYLDLVKTNNLKIYNKVIKTSNFEEKVVVLGNYLLKDMSEKFEELNGIDGKVTNLLNAS